MRNLQLTERLKSTAVHTEFTPRTSVRTKGGNALNFLYFALYRIKALKPVLSRVKALKRF